METIDQETTPTIKIKKKIIRRKKVKKETPKVTPKVIEKKEKDEEINIEILIKKFIESKDEKRQKAYLIALDHLGTSFDIEKSLGFIKFKNNYKK